MQGAHSPESQPSPGLCWIRTLGESPGGCPLTPAPLVTRDSGIQVDTHLMNFRAKDFSFPVAAAAASSKSRLFPESMWPKTPSKPSGDLE